MKICDICSQEHDRKKTKTCFQCVKKRASDRYCKKYKDAFNEKSRIFRERNPNYHKEWRKKNPEKNRIARKIYYRKKHDIPLDYEFNKRKNGEGTIDSNGYKTITMKGHPNQMDEKGRIREHTFFMSKYLGRPLKKEESIHHKNGIRDDNRKENLELWSKAQPPGQRLEDKIIFYKEFLISYGYYVSDQPID
jgi:hypothetical protein